jgi:hypothetical protein
MKSRLGLTLVAMLGLSLPAMAVTFTETFDPGWAAGVGGNGWVRGGLSGPNATAVPLADHAQGGGFLYAWDGVAGSSSRFTGGDNEVIWVDYVMNVPNGTYPDWSINVDMYMNWTDIKQPFGRGYRIYMGDAAAMAWGTIDPGGNNSPTGPWKGVWGGGDLASNGNTRVTGSKWVNDPNDIVDGQINGTTVNYTYDKNNSAALGDLTVSSGQVIFRYVLRLKNNDDGGQSMIWAMDNLTINIPEPTSLSLFALAALPLLRRRIR